MTETDLEPDGLGDVDLERADAYPNAPRIAWGETYKQWPMHRQLSHTQDLAASLNQALDIMQKERNGLSDICRKQEESLRSMAQRLQESTELMNRELAKVNADRQSLFKKVHSDAALIKVLRIKLEDAGGDHV